METLDFSCSSRKREEVDGEALASDKTVPSLPASLSRSLPLLPRPPIVSSFSVMYFVSSPSRLSLLRGAHFCRAFKYCARRFDPLSKVQRPSRRRGRGRRVDGAGKRV